MDPRTAITRRRMANQRLWGPPAGSPHAAVEGLAAMQAQEFAMARWSVAQRAGDVTDAAMSDAFANGSILRTHVLRPTWHFVHPDDIRWMLALSAPRVLALNASICRQLELTDDLFATTGSLIGAALADGHHRTRKEIGAILARSRIVATGLRLGYILMRAELDAIVCSGAPQGKQQTYALVDERAPNAIAFDRDHALAELTRRYYTSRGPATVRDFSRWSSLTVSDGRRGIAMLADVLVSEEIDGRTYWSAGTEVQTGPTPPVVDLVQVYDESIMGYSESRDVLLDGRAAGDAGTTTAPLTHSVLIDGHLAGRWTPIRRRAATDIEMSLHRALSDAETDALHAAVARYASFLGTPVSLGSFERDPEPAVPPRGEASRPKIR
jgi:hypothetical protein